MEEKFIVLTQVASLSEAQVLKSRLAAEDIPCYIEHENMNTLLPGISGSGIKIKVHWQDGYKALDVLYD